MSYFIVHNSEGETSVEPVDEPELLNRITAEDGATYYGGDLHFITCEELNADDNTGYWSKFGENSILIIKGEVVVPYPKQVVTEWEIA